MAPDFQGKVVLVTGGARGIGREICKGFGEAGATVVLLDIEEQVGKQTECALRKTGVESLFIPADVSDECQVHEAVSGTEKRFGRLDVLVNNAAVAAIGSILDHEPTEWDRILAVNLRGVYLCSRSCIPIMKAKGSGVIVNIGSAHSCIARQNYAAYTASKFGVLGLTKAMALDHAPRIRVNAVLPGAVNTEGFQKEVASLAEPAEYKSQLNVRYPLGRIAVPAEVTHCVLFLSSGHASGITGSAVPVDCGLTAAV